ncbi:DNA adenine methylase [Marinobacter sp. UBA2678]|uniref:DNA adenine methylase n=1 Tax=Marinobacter sp. UBA2678 TaxID=1946815 RepID=UPI000C0BAC1C|nr:DNA adenine methylase [Marinobacter sp. UBA2678]MAM85738.1 DNA methyltransferase [Hahellaceae bacterium]|tara:strand:- start:9091 stop:9945 length:855 start_codon:yes stop_codon:yes gene_type:complete
MPSTHTPLRYPGGKSKLFPFLKELVQCNGFNRCHYVEPYAGGAGLPIGLLVNEIVWSVHINDLNPFIFSFWKTVVSDPDSLCRMISDVDVTMDEWNRQRAILHDSQADHSTLEMAFATLFLNRTNRSGILDGGVIGGKEQKGNYKIDARFNKSTLIRKIKKIAAYKSRITVTQFDAIDLLAALPEERELLVNLDPPYIAQGKNLYLNHYGEQDHFVVRNFLKTAGFRWMLTYDDHQLARALYESFNCFKYSLNYSAQARHSATELMVLSSNLDLPERPSLRLAG